MSRPLHVLTLHVLSLVLLLALPANAIDYWPVAEGGLTYVYQEVGGPGVLEGSFHVWQDGGVEYQFIEWRLENVHGDASFAGGQQVRVTADDVKLESLQEYWPMSAQLSPIIYGFDPPLDFVRQGMAPGWSWAWSGTLGYDWQLDCMLSVQYAMVNVPYGAFQTLRVNIDYQSSEPNYLFAPFITSYWLDQHLGPVKLRSVHYYWNPYPGQLFVKTWELVDVQGDVVQTRAQTWTQIRSLFRR
jgi:hypothetical protein